MPEIFESNRQTFEEETPYRVSPPESMCGTLEHDRRSNHFQKTVQQEFGFGFQNPTYSPIIPEHKNLFKNANMMASMMAAAGIEPFPQPLPNMFGQDIFSPPTFSSPPPSSCPPATTSEKPFGGEGIIPIQVLEPRAIFHFLRCIAHVQYI